MLQQGSNEKNGEIHPAKLVGQYDNVGKYIPRPMNAFMIFATEYRQKLRQQDPWATNQSISIRLGNMWKTMQPDQKEVFYSLAKQQDKAHRHKYPDYRYCPGASKAVRAIKRQEEEKRKILRRQQLTELLQKRRVSKYDTSVQIAPASAAQYHIKMPSQSLPSFGFPYELPNTTANIELQTDHLVTWDFSTCPESELVSKGRESEGSFKKMHSEHTYNGPESENVSKSETSMIKSESSESKYCSSQSALENIPIISKHSPQYKAPNVPECGWTQNFSLPMSKKFCSVPSEDCCTSDPQSHPFSISPQDLQNPSQTCGPVLEKCKDPQPSNISNGRKSKNFPEDQRSPNFSGSSRLQNFSKCPLSQSSPSMSQTKDISGSSKSEKFNTSTTDCTDNMQVQNASDELEAKDISSGYPNTCPPYLQNPPRDLSCGPVQFEKVNPDLNPAERNDPVQSRSSENTSNKTEYVLIPCDINLAKMLGWPVQLLPRYFVSDTYNGTWSS